MNKEIIIVGCGVAGIISVYFESDKGKNDNVVIYDTNPLGQLKGKYILGPRILKYDYSIDRILKELNIKFKLKDIKIGYIDENGSETTLNSKFKSEYSLITRGTDKYEKTFLSSGKNTINVATNENDDIYIELIIKMYEKIKHLVVNKRVTKIDNVNKKIYINDIEVTQPDEIVNYNRLIFTANFDILSNLCKNIQPQNKILKKHFVVAEYDSMFDIFNREKYHYMYSINRHYTRKTYQKKYICYEMCYSGYNKKEIEGNKVIAVINNLPIQIQNSVNFDRYEFENIELFGRFAQLKHELKINELLDYYYER